MSKSPRQPERRSSRKRHGPPRPPNVPGIRGSTATAPAGERPAGTAASGPRVIYGAELERERFITRRPPSPDDVRQHQINLGISLVAGVVLLIFAIWTIIAAANEAATAETVGIQTPIVASIISGVAGFFGMYALVNAFRLWRRGPRPRTQRARR